MIKVTRTVYLILFFVSIQTISLAKVEAVLGTVPLKDNVNIAVNLPLTNNPEIILSRDQYVISYNKDRRTPNWVAWKLESDQMGSVARTDIFEKDADLENYLSQVSRGHQHAVEPTDYKGSCFDRGHQIPSADRTDTVENNQATFQMTNMIPQTPYLNRVIWEHLEHYTRELVRTQGKKVYVIAGPIYDEDFGEIGPKSDIKVPSKDFKVIVILDANQTPADINPNTPMIAVVMPNTLQDGSHPRNGSKCATFKEPRIVNPNDWQKYQTTLSEVERLSGVNLFPR